MDYKLLHKPLSRKKLYKPIVSGVVPIDLDEIVDRDIEEFLDLLSFRLTGSTLLMDIEYKVVGHAGDTIHIEVNGDPSMIIEQ